MTGATRCPMPEGPERGGWRNALAALAMLPICVAASPGAAAEVSFNISPSSITNDYIGSITFTISNLTAGQTVTVEKYADLNGNGIIDSDEPLVRSFTVTEGQVPLIAEMRNLNVPGDDDGAADGKMTVNVPYPGVDPIFSRIAGTYMYQVSSPTGGFVPLTQAFLITQNTSLPQGATGNITAAANGPGLANTLVVLVEQNANVGVGTFTDANGDYTVHAPPGSYAVVPVAKGLVIDRAAASVNVTANQFVTKNLALNTSSFTVSGTLSDTATGAGIPGTVVTAKGPDGLGTIGFSDTSGNYALPVTSGSWQGELYQNALSELGYVGLGNLFQLDITADISNVDIALPQATALIYGTVTDAQSNPVTLEVVAQDQAGRGARGRSFGPGGSYAVGLVAGTWNVGPTSDDAAAMGFVVQGEGATVTVGDGQAVRQDFTVTSSGPTCVGDCSGDGEVTIDELLTMVNIALGNAEVGTCDAGDANHDRQITVDEILTAVNNALNSCPK